MLQSTRLIIRWCAVVQVEQFLHLFEVGISWFQLHHDDLQESVQHLNMGIGKDAWFHWISPLSGVEIYYLWVTQVSGVVVNTPSLVLCNEESCGSIPSMSNSFYENSNRIKNKIKRNLVQ